MGERQNRPIKRETMTATHENNHVSDRLAACQICGLVQQLPADSKAVGAKCARCDTVIHRNIPNSRARTMAFTLAALVLYVPANLYPVMTMDTMGRHSENTVWAGVVSLCQEGMWFVGGVVFVASILVPVLKLLGLFFLSLNGGRRWPRAGSWIFKIISRIGPWAMLDVFLLAVAVALIKFGRFGRVAAGPGIIAFTAVVIFTILASSSFDPRLIWNEESA
jgi:paraquat-inducible protein A